MRVIGTAGHVDHGKTALIRAMTGIDADRLPEEKARGMTTDLGFAHYRDESGEAIGVVDVPGHERYLRNMVAGAWGLDLVVLVVAADDGWMPQTSLHASIAACLAAPAAVIAVTKADAVEPGRVGEVGEDARERAAALFGKRPTWVGVSSLIGRGVPELKAAIRSALDAAPSRSEAGGARLYVDRAFSPKGGGVVVTGTLRGGEVSVGDDLVLLPRGEKVRVRGVQGYHEAVASAVPVSRTALSLAGVKDGAFRGDLLVAEGAEALVGREFLCLMRRLPGSDSVYPLDARGRPTVRPGVEAELAVGSASSAATLWPYAGSPYLRVVADGQLACPPGSSIVVLRKGGAALLGRGSVLLSGDTSPEARKALGPALRAAAKAAESLWPEDSVEGALEAQSFALAVFLDGWAALPGAIPAERLEAAGLVRAAASDGRAYAFSQEAWATLRARLTAAAASPSGLGVAEAASLFSKLTSIRAGASRPDKAAGKAQGDMAGSLARTRSLKGAASEASPRDALAAALCRLVEESLLIKDGQAWKAAGIATGPGDEALALEPRLKASGKLGLEPGRDLEARSARALKELCTHKRAVPLDGGIFLSRSAYDLCVSEVLRGRKPGDRFQVPEAKERTGMSRKYILPLLNRMESDGLVKRSGDERVVLKTP